MIGSNVTGHELWIVILLYNILSKQSYELSYKCCDVPHSRYNSPGAIVASLEAGKVSVPTLEETEGDNAALSAHRIKLPAWPPD